jgi:hypothetical protein
MPSNHRISAGITDVRLYIDDVAECGSPGFAPTGEIWVHAIANVGSQIVAVGCLSKSERLKAAEHYGDYLEAAMKALSMRTVKGTQTL